MTGHLDCSNRKFCEQCHTVTLTFAGERAIRAAAIGQTGIYATASTLEPGRSPAYQSIKWKRVRDWP